MASGRSRLPPAGRFPRDEVSPGSYDDFQNRYQGVVRKPDSDAHALTVHVYLDEKGGFRSLEVRDSYTAP